MQDGRSPVILLTGASTGLGLAIARSLLGTGYHLVLTARSSSLHRFRKLGFIESDRLWIRSLNVTDPEERRSVIGEVSSRLGGVDVLINNAGFSYRAVLEHVTEAERLEQFAVNFRGPLELIRLSLPKMRERRAGKIINISSVAGMMAMPTMGIYSASKFALEGASESLWYELRPWNISVTLVEPGFIKSNSFERVKYTEQSAKLHGKPSDPYHQHYLQMAPFIERLMRRTLDTPERIAKRILRIISDPAPPLRVEVTWDARLFSLLRRLLPRTLYHLLLYRMLPGVKSWGTQGELLPLSKDEWQGAEQDTGRRVSQG